MSKFPSTTVTATNDSSTQCRIIRFQKTATCFGHKDSHHRSYVKENEGAIFTTAIYNLISQISVCVIQDIMHRNIAVKIT